MPTRQLISCHKKGYGTRSGNPRETAPDPTRCAKEVHTGNPEEERRKRSKAQWRAQMAESLGPRFLAALRKIAEGHDDPRGFARSIVENFDRRYPRDPDEEEGQ